MDSMDIGLRTRCILVVTLALFAFVNGSLSFASMVDPSSTSSKDCVGEMPAGSHDCPCCPDGAGAMASCLSHCAAQVLATPTLPATVQGSKGAEVRIDSELPTNTVYPPPDPPPIR
jgi:hypothetical protein